MADDPLRANHGLGVTRQLDAAHSNFRALRGPFAIPGIVYAEPFGLGTDVGGYRISFDMRPIAEAETTLMFWR